MRKSVDAFLLISGFLSSRFLADCLWLLLACSLHIRIQIIIQVVLN